ncbi:uncharacterized protein [Oryza sativa Japonica Group]
MCHAHRSSTRPTWSRKIKSFVRTQDPPVSDGARPRVTASVRHFSRVCRGPTIKWPRGPSRLGVEAFSESHPEHSRSFQKHAREGRRERAVGEKRTMESAGSGSGHAATPVRYVALPPPRGVRDGGGWNVLVPESMASEWTVAHVRGVVRVASRGGGAPEVSVDMAALQAALNGRRRGDDDPDLHLRPERGGGRDALTPVRYVALLLPRGVRDGGWNILVPEAMASEWTVVHVPAAAGVVRVASRGGGAPEVSVNMAALQAALNGPRRGDDPDHLHLRSGHSGVGGGVAERGGGGGAGGPCYVPVVFVLNTSKEAEKKEHQARMISLLMLSTFAVYLLYAMQHISKDTFLTVELLQFVGHIVMWAVASRVARSTNRSEPRLVPRSFITVTKKNA